MGVYGMQRALYSSLESRFGFTTTIRELCEDSVRMANELRTEVEQVKEREDVKQALKQTGTFKPEEKPKAETKDKVWLGTHAITFLALAALYLVLQFKLFGFAPRFIPWIQAIVKSAMGVVLLLAVAKIVDVYVIGRIVSPVSRYN